LGYGSGLSGAVSFETSLLHFRTQIFVVLFNGRLLQDEGKNVF
jgi:hypothetical protein